MDLSGPAGRLEALLNEGQPAARFAALVCHPHPLHGGTMHNKVVYQAMKTLNHPSIGLGFPVLRFNFRGVGLSQGAHDGRGETGDVLAAAEWLEQRFGLPLLVAGFSFGAAMALAACCGRPGVRALVALGLPTQAMGRHYHYRFLAECATPKLLLSGGADPFASEVELKQIVAGAAAPTALHILPGADHFLTGHLDQMRITLRDWILEQIA